MCKNLTPTDRSSLDLRYLSRSEEENTKPFFSSIFELAKVALQSEQSKQIIEVGCATGAFLSVLTNAAPHHLYTGLDILPLLIEQAKRNVPRARFIAGDLFSELPKLPNHFDILFSNGIHSMFDDLGVFMKTLSDSIASGGKMFFFGPFNPEPLDIIVRVHSKEFKDGISGWNIFSLETLKEISQELSLDYTLHKYSPPPLERNSFDPLASWSVNVPPYENILVNGTQILQHHYTVVFTKA